jgi:serine/threonine-protein kinase
MAVSALPPLPAADGQLGPFRLIRLLGLGGMAEVWRAEWSASDGRRVPVAFKRILPWLSQERTVRGMFLDEARLALQLRHAHIVRALDAGTIAGSPYLALEMIDGVDLLAIIRTAPSPLPLGFVLHVAHAVAGALAYAHQLRDPEGRWLGLVHRDVSPSNVMIGRDGAIKLLDFGVAKAAPGVRHEVTRFGFIKGKLGYIAPELFDGAACDERADLFSLGVVLWELFARRRLFFAADDEAQADLNRACVVAPPSQHDPAIPPAVEALVLRALARDPAQRFQRAIDMEAALAQACVEHPWTRADTRAFLRASDAARTSRPSGAHQAWGPTEGAPVVSGDGAGRLSEAPTQLKRAVPTQPRAAAPTQLRPAAPIRGRRTRRLTWALAGVGLAAAVLLVVVARDARRIAAEQVRQASAAPSTQRGRPLPPPSLPDPPRLQAALASPLPSSRAASAPSPRPVAARSRHPAAPAPVARAHLDLRHLFDPLAAARPRK